MTERTKPSKMENTQQQETASSGTLQGITAQPGSPKTVEDQERHGQINTSANEAAETEVEAVGEQTAEPQSDPPTPPLYSVFSSKEKTFIVITASLAALFSPLSANIYYPALNTLAKDLHVSNSLINLTVTTYLIFQGLAPMFIGSIADAKGRRPAYLICFTIYIAACIGLALQSSYTALMILRCLQSSGSSGTVALANAMISDIVTSSERGSYMGYALMGGLIGPAIGPVIGGVLDKFLGWRSIFWFLVIFGSITVLIIGIFLPETARNVVGNGSLPAQRWNSSLISYLKLRKLRKEGVQPEVQTRLASKRPNPMKSIQILYDKESGPILLCAGILFAGYYMVITSLPSQLALHFHFNTLQIGLVYIPTGFGAMTAAICTGKFLDWNFARHAKLNGIKIEKGVQQDLSRFPIEAARLQVVIPLMTLSGVLTITYGFVIEKAPNLGAIVTVLYFMSVALSGTFQGLSTLVVDLNRSSPGAATGAMNFARCLLGAGGVALVGPLIDKVGNGWMAVLVAGSWALLCPIVLLVMKKGPGWREKKEIKKIEANKSRQKERKSRDVEAGDVSGVADGTDMSSDAKEEKP